MIYYANPSTEAIRDAMLAGDLGCITTPHQGNVIFPEEFDTIADNGCFSDRWTPDHWWSWLIQQPRSIRWAVCPDVFDPSGDECHEQTLERWHFYAPIMRRHGFTPAFVCQVGCTWQNVPDDADVLFIGGTNDYKLGPYAWNIAQQHRRDRWIHMGRVNSQRRFEAARSMGCHSVDGTFLTFGPDANLPRLLSWVRHAGDAPMLFDEADL